MQRQTGYSVSLFLRIAISASFLSAVADRFGLYGEAGTAGVSWGDWPHFVQYVGLLNPFVSTSLFNPLAIAATALEIIFPIMLLTGFKLKWAAIGSGSLLLLFAFSMTLALGFKAPLDYSVWTGAAACFALSILPARFTIDQLLNTPYHEKQD